MAQWLLRAVAGDPADLQIMYTVAGERRLTEFELPWLQGYEDSAPVRIGNAASEQLQIDVYGEVMDALYQARVHGLGKEPHAWPLQKTLLGYLEDVWHRPDEGIWEIRGKRRHFVHSKVMAWVAFDRAVRTVEEQGLDGPVDEWRVCATRSTQTSASAASTRSAVRSCSRTARRSSTRVCSFSRSSASSPPPTRGFAARSRRSKPISCEDGLVLRYRTHHDDVDGLPAGEGVFLPCSFWLVDCYELTGRHDDAHALFEQVVALGNDLGLLAEEYDPVAKRLLGNFPQAFTHLALVNSAFNVLPHLPSPMQLPARAVRVIICVRNGVRRATSRARPRRR